MKRLCQYVSLVILSLFVVVTMGYAQNAFSPGTVLEGSVQDKNNKNFQTIIKIETIDNTTGNFSGDITWPSLNSVHRIEGRLSGNTITFKEVSHHYCPE